MAMMTPMVAVPCQGFQPIIFVPVAVPMQLAAPEQEASANTVVPKHVQRQFRKTRLCNNFQKGVCRLGQACRFAHSSEELHAAPDLRKTKLCFNFFRGQCSNKSCDFAHGYEELRKTEGVYKTELCHGWAQGKCRFGTSCRFAHGDVELRGENPSHGSGDTCDVASDSSIVTAMRWSDFDSDCEDEVPAKAESTVATESTRDAAEGDSDLEVVSMVSAVEASKTSLRICGLSSEFSRAELLELLDGAGFAGRFDFVYIPSEFSTGRCFGYAFVNFVSPAAASEAVEVFEGHDALTVGWADTQGVAAYVERFRNSPVMHANVPDAAKPAMFQHGIRVAFPAPTKRIAAPRMKRA